MFTKTLILFFPKYTFASGTAQVADACSFHLFITSEEESPFLRYLRQQHTALAKDGKTSISLEESLQSQLKDIGHLSVRSNALKFQFEKNNRGFSTE